MKTRKALGLVRMEDEAPSIDTYYLLRRRICEYADLTGENLMETCFSRLTKFQASKFKLSGKSVRMDSKLIGELGRIIYAVLVRVKAKDGLLKRVFEEQYIVEHGQVTPRDRKAISADNRSLAVNGVFTGIQGRHTD